MYILERIYSLTRKWVLLSLVCAGLSSCFIASSGKGGKRTSQGVTNSPDSVDVGFGRLLLDNPIVLSGDPNLSPNTDMGQFLRKEQDFITFDQFLIGDCIEGIDNCFQVQADSSSPTPLQSTSKKWAFDANSSEFIQVNTFGHMDRIIDKFHDGMKSSHTTVYPSPFVTAPSYQSSIPNQLFTAKAHWNGSSTLIGHADCGLAGNAFFAPATFTICLGEDATFPQVKFAHDNTILFHEMGHAFTKIMLNMRNLTDSINASGKQSDMGALFYDEAGSIGEGIADYFSYYVNHRPHIGEWSLGRFLKGSRPLREDDPLHAPGINVNANERLSYPAYVNYDPNFPTEIVEDVHVTGQIISHYLVAFTEQVESTCSMTKTQAVNYVVHVMTEALGEMGDLTSRGNEIAAQKPLFQQPYNTVNLNQNHSKEWIDKVNPISFRRFAQAMAKAMNLFGSSLGQCKIPQDNIEQLLDQYGLLLFKTYNENGNGNDGHTGISTAVSPSNRIRSVLIPKDFLILDPTQNASQAFVFDSRQEMVNVLEGLQASGQIGQISTQLESDLPFNNGNARISPGEFVGIALNLFNDSNSTMAGVQLLANDWDHFDEASNKACNNVSPANFPSSSEGGTSGTADCNATTTDNGDTGLDKIAPICLVQINDNSSTRWGSQSELRAQINLDPTSCLGGVGNEKDCFIRAVKGGDHAYYSRIEPKQTWGATQSTTSAINFNISNIVYFEVSPDIPPGTTFTCRFRARFSNCDDCFSDPNNGNDDFLDFEYSGFEPFKVIDFQFTVID